jgi:ABC-type nitrate/sulfonate/bicarbonate transport system permease component
MPQTILNSKLRRQVLTLQIFTPIILLSLWELVARSGLLYEGVAPTLVEIVTAFWNEVSNPILYHHFGVTFMELFGGFTIATILGVLTGISLGSRPFASSVAEPYLTSLATTPKIIFLPVVMLMFGIGPESKVAIGALAGFFPIVISTMAGTLNVRPVLINVGRALNLSRWQMLRKIYLPSIIGPIIRGMRLGLGVTIIAILLGEIKLSNAGLGFLAIEYYNTFNIARMYSILIIIFLTALTINSAMSYISQRFDRA